MNDLKESGNSTMEYALSIALVIISGILTIALIDLPEIMRTSFANTTNGRIVDNTVYVSHLARRPWTGGTPILKENVCFNSGLCIDLPIIMENGTVEETAGGLGGELAKAFASVLQQLSDAIKASPSPDPELSNLITQLANRGHNIGDRMIQIDQTLWTYGCDKRLCTEDNMEPNGKFAELAANAHDVYHAELSKFRADYTLLKEYLINNPSVATTFPEAAVLIDLEASQIKSMAKGVLHVCTASDCVLSEERKDLHIDIETIVYPATKITEKRHKMHGGVGYLEIIPDLGTPSTYKYNNETGTMELYTGIIPTTYNVGTNTFETFTLDGNSYNNGGELVHQDANVICSIGGNVANCVTP